MDEKLRERLRRITLMDDRFMRVCLQEHPECAQAILRIVMEAPSLRVREVRPQREYANLHGREIRMDIFAEDEHGRQYDVDVQRSDEPDLHLRAGYYLGMLRANSLRKGQGYGESPEAYVIFITSGDFFQQGLPLYRFEQRMEGSGQPLGDRSHIIFVNGAMRDGDTPLSRLMHDFFCTDPDTMYVPELAQAVRDIKGAEKGAEAMSGVFEEIFAEGREEGRAEGIAEGLAEGLREAARRMLAAGSMSIEAIARMLGLDEAEVRSLAAAQ